jgi:hypothetical protein
VGCESLRWGVELSAMEELEQGLRAHRWVGMRLSGVPNGRLAREAAGQQLIGNADEQREVASVRRQLQEMSFTAPEPEDLWQLGERHGYTVEMSPGEGGCCEVQFIERARAHELSRASVQERIAPMLGWNVYANDPLENGFRQHLIPQLREYLKTRLPEYMIPSGWMVLKQLPLTVNGKVDRAALPAPQSRPEEMGEYVAPRTDLERTLAEIWAQVLRVDQVGRHDNFFELGGHSLLAAQVAARVASSISVEVSMRVLFEFPTVELLANAVTEVRNKRLVEDIALGGDDIRRLLAEVASMPEGQVQQLMHELRTEGRS